MAEVTKGSITITFKASCVAIPGHHDMQITLTPSDGSINAEGSDTETIEDEILTFADTNEATTRRYIRNLISQDWLGTSLGQVVHIGGAAVRAARKGCAVLRLTYTSFYRVYSITVPPRDHKTYLVLILVEEE